MFCDRKEIKNRIFGLDLSLTQEIFRFYDAFIITEMLFLSEGEEHAKEIFLESQLLFYASWKEEEGTKKGSGKKRKRKEGWSRRMEGKTWGKKITPIYSVRRRGRK